jgi:hypothetical protein
MAQPPQAGEAMKKQKHPWASSKTAADNARRVLPGLAESFFQAGRKAAGEKQSSKALHRFRLEVKRFRYYLELFVPCYGPGLKERLNVLRHVQDYLGDLSDCAATQRMLEGPGASPARDRKQCSAFLSKQRVEKRAAFVLYWRETCDAPGKFEWWVNYLQHFAGRRRATQRKPARRPAKKRTKAAVKAPVAAPQPVPPASKEP